MERLFSIDDFSAPAESAIPDDTEEMAPPAPVEAPAPAPSGRTPTKYGFDEEDMPAPYQEYLKSRRSSRGPQTGPKRLFSIDDLPGVQAAPPGKYDPDSDWAITRGFKTGYTGGTEAIGTIGEMARMVTLSEDEQRKAMIEFGKKPVDPSNASLEVESFDKIGGIGDAWTFVMESLGQMGGSMAAAGVAGGLPAGAAGAAIGAAGGTAVGGVGAIPGAVAGAVTGAGYGTMAAFGPMGVGGMYRDLLQDQGVQEGLANGTVSPAEILTWAGTAGLAIGALDAAPIGKLGKMVGFQGGTKKLIKEGIKKAALKGAIKQAGYEGGTEAMQGAISEFGQAVVGGDIDAGRRAWSVINQGIVGGIGGAGAGAAAGAYEDTQVKVPGTAPPATPSTAPPAASPAPGTSGPSPQPTGPGGLGAPPAPPATGAPAAGGAKVTVVAPGTLDPAVAAAAAASKAPTGIPEEDEGEIDDAETDTGAGVDPSIAAAFAANQPARQPAQQTPPTGASAAPAPPAAPAGQPPAAPAAAPAPVINTPPAPPAPPAPVPAPAVADAAPMRIDRAAIMDQYGNPDGSIDLGAAGDEVKRSVAEAIEEGREVHLIVEGKRRRILSVSRLGMVDKNGNPWGIASILMPKPGEDEYIEIGGPVAAAPAPVPAPETLTPPPPDVPEPGFVPRGPEIIEEEEAEPGIGDIPPDVMPGGGRIFPPIREGAARPALVIEQREVVHPLIAEEMELTAEQRQAREQEDRERVRYERELKEETARFERADKYEEKKAAQPKPEPKPAPEPEPEPEEEPEVIERPARPAKLTRGQKLKYERLGFFADTINELAVALRRTGESAEALSAADFKETKAHDYKGKGTKKPKRIDTEKAKEIVAKARARAEAKKESRGEFAKAAFEFRNAVANTKERLGRLADDHDAYTYLYSSLSPEVQEELGVDYYPDEFFQEKPAPEPEAVEGGRARAKPKRAVSPKPKQKEPQRPAAVALTPKREEEAAPEPVAAESGKRDIKLNIGTWRVWRGKYGLANAVKRMIDQGAVLIDKKTGEVAKLVSAVVELPLRKMKRMPKKPSFEFEGVTYKSILEFDRAGNEMDALAGQRKNLRDAIDAAKKKQKEAETAAQRKEFGKVQELAWDKIREIDKELNRWRDARRTPEFLALRRWEDMKAARDNLERPALSLNEQLVKVSTLKDPLTQPELLRKFNVVIPGVERAEPHAPISTKKSDEQLAIDAMREHFAEDGAAPVKLSALGFSKDKIAKLTAAGLAKAGGMTATEFRRWQGSTKGLSVPSGLAPARTEQETKAAPKGRLRPEAEIEPEEIDTSEDVGKKEEEAPFERELKPYQLKNQYQLKSRAKGAPKSISAEAAGLDVTARQLRTTPVSTRASETPLVRAIPHKETPTIPKHKKREGERMQYLISEITARLPDALKTQGGLTPELMESLIRDAARRGARSQEKIVKEEALLPLQAARERWQAGLESAVAAYKRGEAKAIKEYLDKQDVLNGKMIAEQQKQAAEKAAEAATRSKTSEVTGRRASVAMADEHWTTTRDNAYRERSKAPSEQNDLLIKIASLWDDIDAIKKTIGKGKLSAGIRADLKTKINKLHAQRIIEQQALEASEAAAEAEVAQLKQQDAETFEADMREWALTGMRDEESIQAYREARQETEVYKKMRERAFRTTPIIRKSLEDMPPPKGPGETASIKAEADFIRDLGAWAQRWTKAARAALAKAGVRVNVRYNKQYNTPEENVLIFTERLMGEPKYKGAQKRVETIETALEGQPEGVLASSPGLRKAYRDRGFSMTEAYLAINLLNEPYQPGMTSAQSRLKLDEIVEDLHGLMTDAARTKSTVEALDPHGAEAVKGEMNLSEAAHYGASKVSQPIGNQFTEALGGLKQAEYSGPQFELIKRRGRLDAPEVEEGLPEGVAQTMSGDEALSRYAKETQGLTGWRKMVRRALVKTLRKMVGDVPVHFVNGEIISAYTSDGKERAGTYNHNDGNPIVMIHSGLLERPGLLADTIVHEMVHAATAYAINNNLRGTRDIIRGLMDDMKRTLSETQLAQHPFKNEHEFLTSAMERADFQELLASASPKIRTQALVRALGKGRLMPSYWDLTVAAIQNAIGLFIPGRAGTTYMDQLLRIYPQAAMSSSQQMEDAATRVESIEEDLTLDSPFDMAALGNTIRSGINRALIDKGGFAREKLNALVAPTEEIRKSVANRFFGGKMKNIFSGLVDQLMTYQYQVQEMMADGDKQDNRLRAWMMEDSVNRRGILAKVHELIVNASIDRIDPRISLKDNKWIWDDADHPLPSGKARKVPSLRHLRDSGRRKAHPRYKAEWDALPADLKALVSDRLDLMKNQMIEYETKMVTGFLDRLLDATGSKYILPPGMGRPDAVKEIMDGKMSPDLKTALGRNAATLEGLGKFGMRGGMYAPASRMGTHFISGRRKIATPTAARGSVFKDDRAMDEKGVFRFVFSSADDAVDYYNQMGASGDERVSSFGRKHIDPRSGNFVPHDFHERDAAGNDFYAQPVYLVTMQDRFMAMSDSKTDLLAQKAELEASGEYEGVSEPLRMNKIHGLTSGMPLQLQAMINNVNGQTDLDARDKNLAIDMLTNHFIRTQQGNRITKRMLHRTGVAGFETGADEMFRAFHTNNEMMSRHIVAQDRMPAIAEANEKIKQFLEALRGGAGQAAAMVKLPLDQRDYVNRHYAKADRDPLHADKLREAQDEINARIDGMMRPADLRGEHFINAVQSVTTLNYLAKPVYFGMQAISIPMFTLPNMMSVMSVDGGTGFTRAWRYLQEGMADVGLARTAWKGLTEAALEGKQLLGGFRKREGYMREGRIMRRARDFVEELKGDLDTSGARYADVKKTALDRMKARRAIGQAGLDQANLRMDLQAPGFRNKAYRAIEQSTRIFRGLQEGIETINRAAPVFGYINYYMDKGLDADEAIELAINDASREQVNYSKANWPTWLGGKLAGSIFLFKKLAMQQAYSFYNSLAKVISPNEPGERAKAMVHLATMSAVMWIVGGLVGNPLWEPMRYLLYLLGPLFGISGNWDEAKNAGEKLMADLTTPMTAEVIMYGLPRRVGFDLSSRAALDSLLFFQQPEEMSREEWLEVVGTAAIGAIGTMGIDTVGNIYGLATGDSADKSWPKWLATMPIPGIAKDIFKTYDNVVNGPTTATGVSTGNPPTILQSIAEAAGVRTRRQARPFEQGSAAKHRLEQKAQAEKSALIRRINNSGGSMSRANMRLVNEWNRAHPEKELRINARSITQARRRKREQEKEIREQNVGAF